MWESGDFVRGVGGVSVSIYVFGVVGLERMLI